MSDPDLMGWYSNYGKLMRESKHEAFGTWDEDPQDAGAFDDGKALKQGFWSLVWESIRDAFR